MSPIDNCINTYLERLQLPVSNKRHLALYADVYLDGNDTTKNKQILKLKIDECHFNKTTDKVSLIFYSTDKAFFLHRQMGE